MVTFTCKVKDCNNENVDYNFSGTPNFAECGGCKAVLEPKDLRDDPEPEPVVKTPKTSK